MQGKNVESCIEKSRNMCWALNIQLIPIAHMHRNYLGLQKQREVLEVHTGLGIDSVPFSRTQDQVIRMILSL